VKIQTASLHLTLSIAGLLGFSACAELDQTAPEEELGVYEAALSVENPQVAGPYAACYTTSNISRSQYTGARLYYPCAKGTAPSGAIASGVFAATTLSPGYTNSSSTIFWLADHVTTHGFITLVMAPDNVWGLNGEWRDAHIDAYNELLDENGRSGSPVYQRVNTSEIQIMGFSKGGGGTLMAAQSLTSQGKTLGAVQALAPYFDSWSNVNLISAPTAIHGGSSDIIAPTGSHAVPMFNGLAAATPRLLAIYSGLSHTEWYSGSGSNRYKMKQYITAWMKIHLNGNTGYQAYINGASHQSSWFSTYTYDP
jgi:predicted dienelactone hydrolase